MSDLLECATATPADKQALVQNWQDAFGDDSAFINFVFDQFAGLEHTVLARENGQAIASICAIPVTLGRYKGVYLYGVNTRKDFRGRKVMDTLLRYLHQKEAQAGMDFAVLVPAERSLFDYYARYGYKTLFYRRQLDKPIALNLWAQAEFDSVTALRLRQLRARFLGEEVVCFAEKNHAAMLQSLYTAGATTVETEDGYGVFFQKGDLLTFAELAARDDRAANRILEACRQHTGARQAKIYLPRYGSVFLGEGAEQPYGQLCWLCGEHTLQDPYMGLMGD